MATPAPFPPNEKERLESLLALNQLDTPGEERFDRITRMAQRLLKMPIVLVSLVDAKRVWFKSNQGVDASEISRAVSFCGYAILQEEMMIVPDATKDHRFADNIMVTGPPFIRFFAGQPIKSPQNFNVGTFCLIDTKPREISEEDIFNIKDLAYWVEKELISERLGLAQRELIQQLNNAERKALLDPLTRLWNRDGITQVLKKQINFSKKTEKIFAIAILDIDYFKKINDTYGHPAGDKVLAEVSRRIRRASRDTDAVGRMGGEEFIIVMPDVDSKLAGEVCARILGQFQEHYFNVGTVRIPIQASIGCCLCGKDNGWDETEAIKKADKALYQAKANGRNQFVMD